MKWWIIDNCETKRSAIFEEDLGDITREEAEKEARDRWDRLAESDKKERDEYYVIHAEDPYDGGDDVIEIKNAKWYAVQMTSEDAWDNGSYNYDEAVEMLKAQGEGLIAVIVNDYCEEEIKYDDLF